MVTSLANFGVGFSLVESRSKGMSGHCLSHVCKKTFLYINSDRQVLFSEVSRVAINGAHLYTTLNTIGRTTKNQKLVILRLSVGMKGRVYLDKTSRARTSSQDLYYRTTKAAYGIYAKQRLQTWCALSCFVIGPDWLQQ